MKALLLILTVIGAAITESSPAPAPQFRVSVDKGIITLRAVNEGKVLGKTTLRDWEFLHQHRMNCHDDTPERRFPR